MKKKIFSLFVMLFCIANIKAQDLNKRMFDEKKQTDMMIGNCTRDGILSCEFVSNYNEEYPAYQPKEIVVDSIKALISNIKCVIILGTWCGDSKEQVPRFLKILDMLKIPMSDISYICVDREKSAPGMNVKEKYLIEKVPTFIFYRKDVEIGRIIETPKTTLEQDVLNILKIK